MEFLDAEVNWDLQALYADIAVIKRLELTEWEKTCLRGLLCGYHPEAIADKIFWTASALRVELSRRLYPYISTLVGSERIAWHRVSKLLEEAGYKYPSLKILKRELLNLEFLPDQNNSQVIKASVIIASLSKQKFKNKNLTAINLNDFFHLEAENLILEGDNNSKQGNFSNAIDFYKNALMVNPSVGVLIKIARCYDRLKLYKDSLFICDFTLYHLEKSSDESHAEKNNRKSVIYNFLAGVFHELALNTYRDYYVKTAFEIYQQSLYYSPLDALVAWNIVDLFTSVFKHCTITPEEQNDYVDRAKKALYDFKGILYRPESNFKSYRNAIVSDAERAFSDLGDWWQEQLNELKQL